MPNSDHALSPAGCSPAKPERIASIDALRGLNILVMLFVNDLACVAGVPKWMQHFQPYEGDGMTFVDVVYPAFLFIVGMSIPFALGGRLGRGEPLGRVWRHVLTRAINLILVGLFMVNGVYSSAKGWMNPNLWSLLMFTGIVLTWNTPPPAPGRARKIALWARGAGIALLCALALLYRGPGEQPGAFEMRTSWWGMVGLIGWAYLIAAAGYLLLRRSQAGLMGLMALLYTLYMAHRAGLWTSVWFDRWLDIGAWLSSPAALVMSGTVLGMTLAPDSAVKSHGARIRWSLLYALGMFAAGRFLYALHEIHPMFIINKTAATAPWSLYCAAITTVIWVMVYWMMDVRGWKRWSEIFRPAGENPLFAYILQPAIMSALALIALVMGFDYYEKLGGGFAIGLWRSVAFAFAATWLAGAFKRMGVRLHL